MTALIATTNPGKIREFREMLGGDEPSIVWDDLRGHGDLPAPEETGATFRANAMLKASHYARRLGMWALADDSGLCVNALRGRPGVHSARWAELHGRQAGDEQNNRLLLEQLSKLAGDSWPKFFARFECVLALADPEGRIALTTVGRVQGRIIHEPRGSNGFGYDPLFYVEQAGCTTAELSPEDKHRISHRGEALRRMRALMEQVIPASARR
jgi:XTP/dITP diphosphohydrolase